MNFANPHHLWLLTGAATLALGYLVSHLRRPRFAVRFGNLALLEQATPRRRTASRHLPALLLLAAVVAGSIGAAEPQRSTSTFEEKARVVLAMDVSPSMLASDVAPSRLVASQEAAKALIESLPSSFEFGVVQFSGEAQLLVPPTTDRVAALEAIDGLEVASETGIGEAVEASLGTLLRTTVGDDIPGAIVVMSDGKSTAGVEVDRAARAAADSGISVSTIAFGTTDGEVELSGQVHPVPVDGTSLELLASLTDGEHFIAEDQVELSAAYQQIIEPLEVERVEVTSIASRFVLATVLLLVAAGGTALVLQDRLP